MGLSIPHEGWLSVESDSPIIGTVLVRSASSRTAFPLQTAPLDGMLFSRFAEGGFFSSTLTLVGSAERDATVVITLITSGRDHHRSARTYDTAGVSIVG